MTTRTGARRRSGVPSVRRTACAAALAALWLGTPASADEAATIRVFGEPGDTIYGETSWGGDLDGDGKPDLIVAGGPDYRTQVSWFKNVGTPKQPVFAPPSVLFQVQAPDDMKKAGSLQPDYLRISVVDWDRDGNQDVLVGDSHMVDVPVSKRDQARLDELDKRMRIISAKVRGNAEFENGDPRDDSERARYKQICDLRVEVDAVEVERESIARTTHGFVWLYLRSPPTRTR